MKIKRIVGISFLLVILFVSCKETDLGIPAEKVNSVAGKGGDVVLKASDISDLLETTGYIKSTFIAPSGAVTLSGDVSGAANANTVDKLKNVTITITSLTTNDTLRYNGTAWVNVKTSGHFAGEIFAFGGASCPTGTYLTDGQSYIRANEVDLFAAIACNWGCPDGGTFNVPDLRGRFMRGVNAGTGRDPDASSRTASNTGGNTGDTVGSLQSDAFASHTHTQDAHAHGLYGGGTSIVGLNNGTSVMGATTGTGTYTGQVANATATNQNTGGNETRPKNANVIYCIVRNN